jgi:gamma-glutamyltranspeptidase/glutathione hydrolase
MKIVHFALIAAFALPPAFAAEPLPPIFNNGARFLPVIAEHGMVVAQEGVAAKAGVEILRQGGNAVDAAVATAFALAVTLPRAGNLGGGGFMLIHLAKDKKNIAIDYRETAPEATGANVFLDANGNADPRLSRSTGLAVGVPGTVAGLTLAWQKYGSGKLSLAQLTAPAAALAREGLLVNEDLAESLVEGERRLKPWASSAAVFYPPDGGFFRPNDRLKQKDLTETLEAIGRDGAEAFYHGPIAEKIVRAVSLAGGHMSMADLAAYRAIERAPVSGTYHGHTIVSMPPPSSGGVHILEILNMLEPFPLAEAGASSAKTIHLMSEAMQRAYADRAAYMGDPDQVTIPLQGLTSKTYAAKLRETISLGSATPADAIKPLDPAPYESDQTTHFSVVDADGNAVANTYTLNFSFGLGLVAEGTGVLLNNELDDFAAKPGVPNAYGLTGGEANAPGPRKRPLSSMAPTFVFKGDELELVTGSPGGSRIITIVLGIILDTIEFNMNIAEATAAPRFHDQWQPDELQVERGISPDTLALLEKMGHKVKVYGAWGSAQSIAKREGLLLGSADSRQRGTLAVGY